MGVLRNILAHAAWGGLLLSGFGVPVCPAAAQQASVEISTQSRTSASAADDHAEQVNDGSFPDSPGATVAQAQATALPQDAQTQSAPPQTQQPNQSTAQRPVGAAAAEAPSSSGVAASEPAGVAIAPAKQRRARTIIIKTGAIIGAAVALGVVVGLTEATSSKPPGAH
jgi:hypothetical protein